MRGKGGGLGKNLIPYFFFGYRERTTGLYITLEARLWAALLLGISCSIIGTYGKTHGEDFFFFKQLHL